MIGILFRLLVEKSGGWEDRRSSGGSAGSGEKRSFSKYVALFSPRIRENSSGP
jgi:hypothetical protein